MKAQCVLWEADTKKCMKINARVPGTKCEMYHTGNWSKEPVCMAKASPTVQEMFPDAEIITPGQTITLKRDKE